MEYLSQLEQTLAPELEEIDRVEKELGLVGRYGSVDSGGRAYEIKQALELMYRHAIGAKRWQYFMDAAFFSGKCPAFFAGSRIIATETGAEKAITNGFLHEVQAWREGVPLRDITA